MYFYKSSNILTFSDILSASRHLIWLIRSGDKLSVAFILITKIFVDNKVDVSKIQIILQITNSSKISIIKLKKKNLKIKTMSYYKLTLKLKFQRKYL